MSGPDARGFARATQSAIYRAGISGGTPAVPIGPDELERAAAKALPAEAAAYIVGGAGAERTMAANRAAFDKHRIWPRVLRNVAKRDLSIELFGKRQRTPFVLAPLGVMEMVHPHADLAVAAAAAELGVVHTLSNQASIPMEDVAEHQPRSARWFQLYWSASDALNESLLRRAKASGCTAIVITLDTHLLGWRTRDLDLGHLPFTRGKGLAQYTSDPVFAELVRERAEHTGEAPSVPLRPRTVLSGFQIARGGKRLVDGGIREALSSPLPRAAVETFLDVFSTPALTWDDLAKARGWTDLPILVKGIVHPDDAATAVEVGVDGIWVSNHGGRQIDQSVPTLEVLPEIAARVDTRVPIVFDSGIRSGSDAAIALALGATAVAIGRPYAYGLALSGRIGVAEVIRNHIAELDLTLGLAGHTRIAQLGPDSLRS